MARKSSGAVDAGPPIGKTPSGCSAECDADASSSGPASTPGSNPTADDDNCSEDCNPSSDTGVVEADGCEPCSQGCDCPEAACSALVPSTTARDGWTNEAQGEAGPGVRVEFYVRPGAPDLNGIAAVSHGLVDDFSEAPVAVRFNEDGAVDVRSGGAYGADTRFSYSADTWYEVVLDVDLEQQEYDVQIGECGGELTVLVSGAAFRSDSADVSSVDNVALWSSQAAPLDVAEVRWASTGECVAKTCEDLGATCGAPSDTCGGALDCGSCAEGETCAGGSCRDTSSDSTLAAGLFVTHADLELARERSVSSDPLFAAQARLLASRADQAMSETLEPFQMADVREITFGWCEDADFSEFDTLKDATLKFETDSDKIRTLALQFALTLDVRYADKAVELMLAYQEDQTIVNLHDLDVDYQNATLWGEPPNNDYCSDRPWNFALDAMWQNYGLINVSDAYLLLTRNGYELSSSADATLRQWILNLVEAVNSSFHAWTRWADLHTSSSSFVRYRSDNHLSWALAGLIAGAAALEDAELGDYVVHGGLWTDRRSGEYANPSFQLDVIDRAIGDDGVVFEEAISRDPPIGYSFFHLWAMTLVATVAEVHFAEPILWTYEAPGGGSLRKGLVHYADYILGTAQSVNPNEPDFAGLYGWLYELGLRHWDDSKVQSVLDTVDRDTWIVQSVGPTALVLASP